jgi:hypothetical protein
MPAPGQHLVVFGAQALQRYRDLGFSCRDTLQVCLPGPTIVLGFLVRSPLAAETLTENVLVHGQGGLNINPCRVLLEGGSPAAKRRESSRKAMHAPISGRTVAESNTLGRMERRGSAEVYMAEREDEQLGRWPPNVLLVHGACGEVCVSDCPIKVLGKNANYFPWFPDFASVLDWIQTLLD